MNNLRNLKKTELHRHLEGTIRLQTILDMAPLAGITLPASDLIELASHACVTTPVKDLATMLSKMSLMQSVLATREIIERVAFEACVDAFNEGIRVLELRYSPSFICKGHPSLNYDIIHGAILNGITHAELKFKGALAVGLIGIITREQPLKEAARTTDFVLANRDSFVGFDLAGDEVGFDGKLFQKFFAKVRAAGLGITVHSGEERRPQAAQSVRETVERLGATRIGHGLQIIHDEKIIEFIVENKTVLEICPTSNVYTQVVDSLKTHPVRKLRERGVAVTLNSDDPTFFGIDLTHEYEALSRDLKFNEVEFAEMNQVALSSTFISQDKVQRAWTT